MGGARTPTPYDGKVHQKYKIQNFPIFGESPFLTDLGKIPLHAWWLGHLGRSLFRKKLGVEFFRCRNLLESLRFQRFLSVLGPPGYQKQLSHVPLVLGTIILVPFRPQEARLVPIIKFLVTFSSTFWSKKLPAIIPHSHPPQGPKTEVHHRIPSIPVTSFKTNVSFILSFPKSSKTRKGCFFHMQNHCGGPWCTLPFSAIIWQKHRTKSQMVDLGAPYRPRV